MRHLPKILFILLIVKPLVFVGLGLNLIQRHKLPLQGPAVIAANHNSHLDTLVLLALFPIRMVHRVHPVAAADYFMANRWIAWLSLHIIGIIPIERFSEKNNRDHIFDLCHHVLKAGDILLIFPEGSRGEPETMSELKKGIYHLVKKHPQCGVTPVVMRGLGRSLPKGTAMLVPFNCDVVIGDPIYNFSHADQFIDIMQERYQTLAEECITQVYIQDEDS